MLINLRPLISLLDSRFYYSEYHQGKLLNKEPIEIGFDDMDSPKNGGIIIVPDYDHAIIKLVVWTDDGSKVFCRFASYWKVLQEENTISDHKFE